jgi:hypothetical protein
MLYLSISFPHLIWIPALLCTSIILAKCTCGVWYVYINSIWRRIGYIHQQSGRIAIRHTY